MKKLMDTFTGLDIFGHPITVFFKGKDVYRTRLGALLSIAVYAFVINYSSFSLIDLFTMSSPNIAIIRKNTPQKYITDTLP